MPTIDSILFVSFGGPEGPDDVIPFLENVLRGKPVPRERMLEVAEHYQHFGGISPINQQNRDMISRLQSALQDVGLDLPIIWGNRNWTPYITDALQEIESRGLKHALPIFTNMFSCYSGCRQYRENIAAAIEQVGCDSSVTAPRLRFGFNHPLYIDAQVALISQAMEAAGDLSGKQFKILFTAHSIPMSMADNSNYVKQLSDAAGLITGRLNVSAWELVYQSRSGPPSQPWLEPDIGDRLRELAGQGLQVAIVVPLGFVSDHMEVLFDLDTEAKAICEELGVVYSRAAAVGTRPEFIQMLVALIRERLEGTTPEALGSLGPLHNVCPQNCCLYPRPTAAAAGRPH